jgi:hypothetical protein
MNRKRKVVILALVLIAVGVAGYSKFSSADGPAPPPPKNSAQAAPAPKEQSPNNQGKNEGAKTPPTTAKHGLPITELKGTYAELMEEERQKYHWPADFDLPLVIQIETPPVPPEITGPFPLPKGEAKSPEKQ